MFEYIPHHATLSRPKDATAYVRTNRDPASSVLIWGKNSPTVQKTAKQAAWELTSIVTKPEALVSGAETNLGYGNFSKRSSVAVRYDYEKLNGSFLVDCETKLKDISPGTTGGALSFDDSISRAMFGENYPRLQRVKAQYDPNNIFHQWFPIMPNANAGL